MVFERLLIYGNPSFSEQLTKLRVPHVCANNIILMEHARASALSQMPAHFQTCVVKEGKTRGMLEDSILRELLSNDSLSLTITHLKTKSYVEFKESDEPRICTVKELLEAIND